MKDKEDLCPLDMLSRDIDVLFVDSILYTKFPRNYNPYDPVFSKSCDPEIMFDSKSHKKRKTDVSVFNNATLLVTMLKELQKSF